MGSKKERDEKYECLLSKYNVEFVDADSVTLSLFNPDESVITPVSMVRVSLGHYSYTYQSLSNNQIEPVQSQMYEPLLEQPYSISLQDQLNANQADFNAIQRQYGYNPAALSQLAAQKYSANSAIPNSLRQKIELFPTLQKVFPLTK
jgi:hypothetical protein